MTIDPFTPMRNCDQGRFDRNVERARFFERLGATDVRTWYDAHEDYVRVSFTLEESRYEIRTYKIRSVVKDGAQDFCQEKGFNTEFQLQDFFERKQYLKWIVYPIGFVAIGADGYTLENSDAILDVMWGQLPARHELGKAKFTGGAWWQYGNPNPHANGRLCVAPTAYRPALPYGYRSTVMVPGDKVLNVIWFEAKSPYEQKHGKARFSHEHGWEKHLQGHTFEICEMPKAYQAEKL